MAELITRKVIVIRKRNDATIAAFFSFFLLIRIPFSPQPDESNPDVTRSIIEIITRKRLKSEKSRGKISITILTSLVDINNNYRRFIKLFSDNEILQHTYQEKMTQYLEFLISI